MTSQAASARDEKSVPPRFSVITVVLNNAEGLERTARSIIAQRGASREWIVIDGGSTDGTPAVVERFREHIAVLVSEPDRGLYDAMNKGLRVATGRYVNFMNSGDEYADETVLKQADDLTQEARVPPVMIMGSSLMRMPSGVHVRRPTKSLSYISYGLPALHQAIFFERESHLGVPYPDSCPVCADYSVVAQLLVRNVPVALTHKAFSINEIGGTSHSHRYARQQDMDISYVQRELLAVPWLLRCWSWTRRRAARAAIALLTHWPQFLSRSLVATVDR